MADSQYTKPGITKYFSLLLKIAVTAICIWYVYSKIDFTKAGAALRHINGLFLCLALVAFILSKLISAVRLNIYFKNIGVLLTKWQNIRLYWLGMFYNLFLPGSISGDAWKVILLQKKYAAPYKKTASAVLLDRFSGLLGLGLLLAACSFWILPNKLYVVLLVAGAFLVILVFYLILQKWFPSFLPGLAPTLLLGITVQAVQVVCVYCIIKALGIPGPVMAYIFIFLVSSVLSVLPVTIGGLGIREVVFLEGSRQLGLLQDSAVVISLLFYLVTVVTSAAGLYFVFKDPLTAKK